MTYKCKLISGCGRTIERQRIKMWKNVRFSIINVDSDEKSHKNDEKNK